MNKTNLVKNIGYLLMTLLLICGIIAKIFEEVLYYNALANLLYKVGFFLCLPLLIYYLIYKDLISPFSNKKRIAVKIGIIIIILWTYFYFFG